MWGASRRRKPGSTRGGGHGLEKEKRPVRFLLVGDGPYREEMQKLLPEAVFTGYLEGEELAKAYASADVFVFPSTTDTFGNVVLEAQASGLPASCPMSEVRAIL